jgi:ATP-dependent Zn protease
MDKFQNAIDKIMGYIPLLIFSGNTSPYIIPIIIFIPLIFDFISTKIINLWFTEYHYDIYDETKGRYYNKNPFYRHVEFVLKKHDLMKNFKHVISEDYAINYSKKITDSSYFSDHYEVKPLYAPATNSKIKFIHKNINVEISSGTNNYKIDDTEKTAHFYRIISKDYSQIKKFIGYVKKNQISYINSVAKREIYKFFNYDTSDKKWISNDINVNKTFDHIFLDYKVKTSLIKNIHDFVHNKDKYDEYGISHKIGYLLHGAPGNGKTSIAYAIAKTYDKNIFKVNLSCLKTQFISQISNIKMGSVVLFEDIDICEISLDRSLSNENNGKKDSIIIDKLELGDILEILDGYCFLKDCIIIMTSNHPDKLDPALIRPGRIDHQIEFTNATTEQISQIIKFYFDKEIIIENKKDVSVSELINSIIIPHKDDYEYVMNYLQS